MGFPLSQSPEASEGVTSRSPPTTIQHRRQRELALALTEALNPIRLRILLLWSRRIAVQQQAAASIYKNFLYELLRSRTAWGLSCHGDICSVRGAGMMCLPLWSDGETARRMQQRYWPKLLVTAISLDEVLERCLPTAGKNGVPIGVGVAMDGEAVVVPAAQLAEHIRLAERAFAEMRTS